MVGAPTRVPFHAQLQRIPYTGQHFQRIGWYRDGGQRRKFVAARVFLTALQNLLRTSDPVTLSRPVTTAYSHVVSSRVCTSIDCLSHPPSQPLRAHIRTGPGTAPLSHQQNRTLWIVVMAGRRCHPPRPTARCHFGGKHGGLFSLPG
jgi:hypothetical protein